MTPDSSVSSKMSSSAWRAERDGRRGDCFIGKWSPVLMSCWRNHNNQCLLDLWQMFPYALRRDLSNQKLVTKRGCWWWSEKDLGGVQVPLKWLDPVDRMKWWWWCQLLPERLGCDWLLRAWTSWKALAARAQRRKRSTRTLRTKSTRTRRASLWTRRVRVCGLEEWVRGLIGAHRRWRDSVISTTELSTPNIRRQSCNDSSAVLTEAVGCSSADMVWKEGRVRGDGVA